ncbi:MAG: helix-turn-helix transcriptional regulator [Alphaproteobacteria bacterium]|nr:helix-turn-helix transcriptional regulator [Alphaproteobacteria bacterium]
MPNLAELGIARGKRARAKAANRKAILDAARSVFARIGYEACSIRDIIRETNLASGTFYNYFKSKEEVFEAIADDSVNRFRPRLEKVREEATDLEGYLRAAFGAYFHFLADENNEAIANGAPHGVLIGVRVDTPEMQTLSSEIRNDLELVLMRMGHGKTDTDYLSAAAIGIAREMGDHMLKRRPVDADEAADFATSLVMSGIGALTQKGA